MSANGNHCSFVLLAEFHLLEGAQLKYQFPQPLGVDESVLAMSMLPDGAETQLDDWTIFFLNQTSFNTIEPVLALDLPGEENEEEQDTGKPDLLCVLNLVRTKIDKTLDRGAKVLALAICTRHPFIQIFKPVLLMALDDYLSDPSQDCLARLFDAVNSMDLSGAPKLSRHEKIVMRASERKDVFVEKFASQSNGNSYTHASPAKKAAPTVHRSNHSGESYSSFEEGILIRTGGRDRADTESTMASHSQSQSHNHSPSETSFSLGGSAVWVGDESGLDIGMADGGEDNASMITGTSTMIGSRRRRSTDASSGSSNAPVKEKEALYRQANTSTSYHDARPPATKDTHFFHTTVKYKDHQLPIKMPLSTFPEEVGDYSLITLIKTFSSQPVSGPQHPHLHTSGPQTHPIIVLFNALVTGKRIIFMGHRRPAGEVCSFVLAACALGSGCGAVLRGFIERAFPYANLNNRDEWESVQAYIAGVTNPIFESSRAWDLLLDISTGSVTVAKDILTTWPVSPLPFSGSSMTRVGTGALVNKSGTLKAEGSIPDDKGEFTAKSDNNGDNLFIEDIRSAIEYHYGEGLVRVRFQEYVTRFVRLASRHEEEITGGTTIGWPSSVYGEIPNDPMLGSGIVFNDELLGMRELAGNAHRLDAWRKTTSYDYCVLDFHKAQGINPIKGFDVLHQLFRLRHAKKLPDLEVHAIMRTLADNIKTYDQIVELLSYLLPHSGGLLQLGYGLFHQKESVRDATVDLFNRLRQYPIGVTFLQALNHFQRYSYVRQAHAREKEQHQVQQQSYFASPRGPTPSNGIMAF
ncbi:docking domain of Afi1 for Arf3 in vesicle trafficking-domain-containing protein [Mycena floridula]|nr:docking domain of Afi1 for Arf3 in vesicle trafficking-domain-containing protein [Mycena floridula]